MGFEKPTLAELIAQTETDFSTRLNGGDLQYRRGNLAVLSRTHAGGLTGCYNYLSNIAKQAMIDSATDDYLDRFASIWGVFRKLATLAHGQIKVKGNEGVTIPANTVLRRADNVRYVVFADITIGSSGEALAEVQAENFGVLSNLEPKSIMAYISPIMGASSVVTVAESGISGGADNETDTDLRARLIYRISNPPQGGAKTDYIQWCKECAGITRAYIPKVLETMGIIPIYILTDNSPTGPIPAQIDIDTVQAYLNDRRPVTARPMVFAPVADPLNFTIQLTPNDDPTKQAVIDSLKDLIRKEAEPGKGLLISHIREAVSVAAGEYDHVITTPTANVSTSDGHIITFGTITWA